MALKKELKILVTDSLGGEEWLDVLAIDFEEDIADVADGYDNTVTLDLNADNVHDIRIVSEYYQDGTASIERRTKELKVGDTMYSSDGMWFPFESIQAYLEYDPSAISVLTGKIKCFEVEGISEDDKKHFDQIEDYQGRRPHFIVDSIELVKVENELKVN